MTRIILVLLLALSLLGSTNAQNVTLYDENFDGATHTFNLTGSTSGVGNAVDQNGRFRVNDNYVGGSGTWECFWPTLYNFTAPTIADQPAGVVFSPNSKYLHVESAFLADVGINNAALVNYESPICQEASSIFTKMSPTVNTEGLTDVILSFYWLCGGGNDTYGAVYYKADGGPWTLITDPITNYSGQPTWDQQFISLPEFEDLATLRFGFQFNFGVQTPINKRGFSIDDVRIVATDLTVGIDEETNTTLHIYPNPVNETLFLDATFATNAAPILHIHDVSGALVKAVQGNHTIDVSDLEPGIYFLNIEVNDTIKRTRFVKT